MTSIFQLREADF